MSKNCVMCNKKIGLFEKMYEDKYCKECYEIMQNEKETKTKQKIKTIKNDENFSQKKGKFRKKEK